MNAKQLVEQMSLEEVCSLLSGGSQFTTKEIPRLSIPALFLADGRSYRVETNDDLHVLTYLQGPYPEDFTG